MISFLLESTYHVESGSGIHLDAAMKITKQNGHGKEQKVDRIANIMTKQFDEFANKHPGE